MKVCSVLCAGIAVGVLITWIALSRAPGDPVPKEVAIGGADSPTDPAPHSPEPTPAQEPDISAKYHWDLYSGWWEASDAALKVKIHFDYRLGTFYSSGKWKDLDGIKFLVTEPLQFIVRTDQIWIQLGQDARSLYLEVFREPLSDSSNIELVRFVPSSTEAPFPGERSRFFDEPPEKILEIARNLHLVAPGHSFDGLFAVLKLGDDPTQYLEGGSAEGPGGTGHHFVFDLGFESKWLLVVDASSSERPGIRAPWSGYILNAIRIEYRSGKYAPSALVFPHWSMGKVIDAPPGRSNENLTGEE